MSDCCPTCGIDIDKIKLNVDFDDVKLAMKHTNTFYCMECGKCSSTCPVALVNPDFSPRKIVSRTLTGGGISLLTSQLIWACLTCNLCNDHCPSDVHFIDFISEIRGLAGMQGNEIPCSHGGTMQSLMRLMTSTEMKQNRLDWVTEDLDTAETGEYMLFVGCLPYYDAYFDELELDSLNIAKSAVRLLNKLDIIPALSNDERCCGHDLRWSGETDMFRMLIERNVNMISKTGAGKIITTCAECYRTLKLDYPDYVDFPFEVMHISEFLSETMKEEQLKFKGDDIKATFHDPCRLSRHSNVIDAPRNVLKSIPGLDLTEMTHHGIRSSCCGTSSWMHCDMYSRMIQSSRLTEAKDTGADLLITACPKCMIHFKCTQKNADFASETGIDIKDLTELVSDQVE